MEGRVLWYKPGSGRGCLTSDAGRQFAFETEGGDRSIRGGARVTFKVSELDGDLVGVNVQVTRSCLEAPIHHPEDRGRESREVMALGAESRAPGPESVFAGHSPW